MDENKILRINFEHGRIDVDGKRMTTYDAQGRVLWYMDAEEAQGCLFDLPHVHAVDAPKLLGRALGFVFEEAEP